MKHLLSITFFMMLGLALSAQDVITTKDGSDIQAKILEVTLTRLLLD